MCNHLLLPEPKLFGRRFVECIGNKGDDASQLEHADKEMLEGHTREIGWGPRQRWKDSEMPLR
jgi:hypothetical protein